MDGSTYDDGCDDGGDEEGKIDLYIREEDEPFVPRAFLELSGAFSTAYRASGVFSANACVESVFRA